MPSQEPRQSDWKSSQEGKCKAMQVGWGCWRGGMETLIIKTTLPTQASWFI